MNGTAIPFFPEMDNEPQKLETVNQSEGGRDIVQVIRDDKMSVSVKMEIAGVTWVKFFYGLYKMDAFVLKQYNPFAEGYDERTVRMENFKYKAKKKSERLAAVTGVWEVSFKLEEF
jgi:hypothetical protein